MTYQEFEQKVKKKTGFDKYWYYGLCIFVIGLCSFLILHFLIHPEKVKTKATLAFIRMLLVFLIALAIYGLYKLPNRYKIITLDNSLPLTKKKTGLEQMLSQMGVGTTFNDNYCSFTYRKRWWSSSYDVYLFFDDNSVCFSVQGQDYYDGGFIDFGGTENFRKKLADYVQTYVV